MNHLWNEERNKEIFEMRQNGMTYKTISEKYNITRQRAQQICRSVNRRNAKSAEEPVNKNLLLGIIYKRGETAYSIAKKLGISTAAMSHKLNGDSEFKMSEVAAIKRILNLTDLEFAYIFFRLNVAREVTHES